MKKILIVSAVMSVITTGLALSLFTYYKSSDAKTIQIEHVNRTPGKNAMYIEDEKGDLVPLDFTNVASEVMDAVVHIKSTQSGMSNPQSSRQDPFEEFFRNDPFRDFFFRRESPNRNPQPQLRVGQGSGVIISDDGYIVTNNHVIDKAEDLEVTLHDKRTYKATIVGTDPSTDLALIRIKESNLKSIPFVNSDEIKIGEWVLAVGNPFNLTSTVTAGIVSAKGRNINILKEQFAIESFIQTDAAINPGNSGGALVDLDGGLVGINTAIASPTGSYSGYGFAIPANMVSKIVEDLIKYGVVQRGVLGVMIRTVDGNLSKQENLDLTEGAYVDSLMEVSAAAEAGIEVGDVITKVNDISIKSSPELQEVIARYRPGDRVTIEVNRKGKLKSFDVVLNNQKGNTDFAKKEHKELLSVLGANIETLDKDAAEKAGIKGGVVVKELYAGKLRRETNMREGFIITHVNGKAIKNVDSFIEELEGKSGGVMLEGVYQDLPGEYYYAFGMNDMSPNG